VSLVGQYVAVVLLDKGRYQTVGGSIETLRKQFSSQVGSELAGEDLSSAMQILEQFAAAESDYSPLSGGYWKIVYDNFQYYFIEKQVGDGDDAQQYNELSLLTNSYPILQAYARQGSQYAKDARENLKRLDADGWKSLREDHLAGFIVPASDRIVKLDHNQISAAESPISELLGALERDNGDPDQPGFRERLLGQIRAGRELIRSGEFRAYLLYETLVRALGELVTRYKDPTISALANALLGALVGKMI
jgi:hypothetical protein